MLFSLPALRRSHFQPLVLVRHSASMRKAPVCACAAAMLLALLLPAQNVRAFGFDDVARSAEQLAAGAYKKPNDTMPKELAALTQEQYHDIRIRPERILWRDAKLPASGLSSPLLMRDAAAGTARMMTWVRPEIVSWMPSGMVV